MAGIKETPRQKMIGMMYLVLTAILALNVSKDLLNAFIVINDGLERTSLNLSEKNASLMDAFRQQMAIDQAKTRPFYERATEISLLTSEMDVYINDLKDELIRTTAGYNIEVPDTMYLLHNIEQLDNYDIPTHVLIGSEPSSPRTGKFSALELKERIHAYALNLIENFPGEANKPLREKILANLELKDVPNVDGQPEPWEVGNFYHLPLAACITNLSKLQTDIQTAESDALKALYDQITLEDFKFDTIAARVIPRSSYVLLGDDYEAQVFLAAFSRTEQPEMLLGSHDENGFNLSDTLTVKEGIGKVRFDTSKEGLQSYGGVIRMTKSDGSTRDFRFEGEYLVARPSLTVAPTKMNVLYKGVNNPVDISVPGIPSEHLKVSISGGNTITRTSDGSYEVTMSRTSPRDVEISVAALLDGENTRPMGACKFRVKDLPKPYAQIGNLTTSGRMSAQQLLACQGIRALYDANFEFALNCRVTSFELSSVHQGNAVEIPSSGNTFSQRMKEVVPNLRTGSKVTFTKIMAVGDDGLEHELSPIVVTLI